MDHTADITRGERRTLRSLLPFAIIIALVAIIWLAFVKYL
jgi:hypothetical protein